MWYYALLHQIQSLNAGFDEFLILWGQLRIEQGHSDALQDDLDHACAVFYRERAALEQRMVPLA